MAFDRNGVELRAGQSVLVHQDDKVARGVVCEVLSSRTIIVDGF
jgi:hypothetical protein